MRSLSAYSRPWLLQNPTCRESQQISIWYPARCTQDGGFSDVDLDLFYMQMYRSSFISCRDRVKQQSLPLGVDNSVHDGRALLSNFGNTGHFIPSLENSGHFRPLCTSQVQVVLVD